MAKLKLISKKSAGGTNFNYTYLCTCDDGKSSNIVVTSPNDVEAYNLAQSEAAFVCADQKEDLKTELEFPTIEIHEIGASNRPLKPGKKKTKNGTYINYSLRRDVGWSGDRLYGKWSQNIGVVCAEQGIDGFFWSAQFVSPPADAGSCGGQNLISIETRD